MRNERGKISGTAMVLFGVVVVLTVGVAPILDFAYTIGLYAKPTAAEVEAEYIRKGYAQSVKCEEGIGGWSFVCDAVFTPSHRGAKPLAHRVAIESNRHSALGNLVMLPLDKPMLAKAEYDERRRAALAKSR